MSRSTCPCSTKWTCRTKAWKTCLTWRTSPPNLMLYPQASGFVVPSMRGISSNPETMSVPVGLYVDGVPVLNPNGFEEEFIDIERIEVPPGPQATAQKPMRRPGHNPTGRPAHKEHKATQQLKRPARSNRAGRLSSGCRKIRWDIGRIISHRLHRPGSCAETSRPCPESR